MEITEVLVQSVDKPLGTGGHPYFSWKIISEEKNTLQQNYRLTVTTQDGHVCMDTGVVSSRKNAYVPYSGEPLNSRTAYTVMLEVTDNHGETATAVSFFETGLLHREDWQSNWIIAEKKRKKAQPGFGKQFPSTLFRQSFPVKSGLKQARLHATAHGVYELYINGAPADERCFAPEHTVYGKYLCVQTYDVTKLLAAGSNAIGFHVGDGWYFSPNAKPNMKTDNQHAVLYQLELLYENGERQLVSSGEDAQTSEGPVVSADLYAGELYDAAREIRDWSKSTCREGQWTPAKVKTYGYDNLVPQCGDRVIAVERFPVKDVLRSPRGECILDFGQNLAGRVRITMPLKEGQRLRLEHCEVLDREGNYYNNIMSAGGVGKGCDQTDEYISDGADVSYEPHFTYHGFRYARLTVDGKAPETVDPAWFTAVLLSSEKKDVGSFSCSDEALNRLYRNIRYSQASNMLSIPTDCPQREKAGWTGDMLVYARTAMLNEDCTVLFSRWLENMSKEQDRYGIVPMVVPENGAYPMTGKLMNLMAGAKGKATSSGWGDAAVIVPYSMYEVTGNTEVLKRQYYCMRRWCDYIIRQAKTEKPKDCKRPDEIEQYLWDTGYHYGEWLVPSQSKNGLDTKNLKKIMAESSCYTAPIFGWYSVSTFAHISRILSEEDPTQALYATDAPKYAMIADKMKEAIQKGVIGSDGSMPSTLMGAYVLPLYFDLVPEAHKKRFADDLVRSIETNDFCLDTGFLATPFLLDALCKIGQEDLAYRLLWQTKAPSWLSEVEAGGTTIWENCFGYDEAGNPGTLSFNHYAFGSVADWIYRNVNGIAPAEAGFGKVIIAPKLDGKLTSASRTFDSVNGEIASDWHIEERNGAKHFCMQVKIPCNCEATVILPSGKTDSVGSGVYSYEDEI